MVSDLTTQGDATMAAPISFCIPQADLKENAHKLGFKDWSQIRETLSLLQQIHFDRNKSAALRTIAARYHGRRGFSENSLSRKYYAYIASQSDWRTLIDRAKAGPAFWNLDAPIGLPKAFLEFWKSLCERNQRCNAPARRELLRIWKTGQGLDPATGKTIHYKKFPGYPDWSLSALSASPREIPPGWSPANLNRHAPSKFELAVARHGREGASAYRRQVFTTRVGLHVGQFYLFDDLEYDLLVNFPGNRLATRPLGLVALDLLSACAIGLGFKPVVIDPEGTKRKLKERDMLWLVADVLCTKGYRPVSASSASPRDIFPGTTLIVEHGTAAIRADFEARIATATGGSVRVQRSGISNEHLAGLFEGASKGNPRFKAALESLFNLVHNEGANLPAQTGLDRQHSPTQTVGLQKYNTQLLKLAEQLPAHRRELLQFPVMTFQQFVEVTLDIFKNINTRTDHDLEGWEKSGFIEQEFTLQIPSAPSASPRENSASLTRSSALSAQSFSQSQWLSLPAHQRAALKPLVNARARQLSPQEVWNRSAHQLQKLGNHALPILLGPDFGVEKSVSKGYITIEDQELSSEPLRFPALLSPQCSMPNAQCSMLNDGQKFLTYLNPHNLDQLILTDAQGRYLGVLERQETPCRADVERVHRQLAAAKHEEAQRLAPVVTRALPLAESRRDMHQNNARVFEGQPITDAEIESAHALRARIKRDGQAATDDMLPDSPSDLSPAAISNSPEPSVLDDTLLDEML